MSKHRKKEKSATLTTERKLIAYDLCDDSLEIRAAPTQREWMDKTRERFAYRCLPLVIANQQGWQILCPCTFSAEWDGGSEKTNIRLSYAGHHSGMIDTHFGAGVLTFSIGLLFRTPPNHNIWVKGPSNHPKDGIYPLEGVIETDWSPYSFTMNWLFTRANHPVTFEKGEPICQIYPYPRNYLEKYRPEIVPIQKNPALQEQYTRWSLSRTTFIKDLEDPNSAARDEKWQRTYMHGKDQNGKAFPSHQTKLAIREFEDKRPDKG